MTTPQPPTADDWRYTAGEPPLELQWGTVIWALGRYGDVFGPMPVEMIDFEAWRGNMLHASHDLVAYAECRADWRDVFPYQPRDPSVFGKRAASGMEAGTVETEGLDAKHDSPTAEGGDAPNPDPIQYRGEM